MTAYLWLAAGVAAPVSAAALVVLARAGRRVLGAALLALVALLVLTAVFDNVIVGTRIVAYHADRILGVRLGVAPIEDLSYTVVAALALPALWTLLGRRAGPASSRGTRAHRAEAALPREEAGAPCEAGASDEGRRP